MSRSRTSGHRPTPPAVAMRRRGPVRAERATHNLARRDGAGFVLRAAGLPGRNAAGHGCRRGGDPSLARPELADRADGLLPPPLRERPRDAAAADEPGGRPLRGLAGPVRGGRRDAAEGARCSCCPTTTTTAWPIRQLTFIGNLTATQGMTFADGYFYYQDSATILRVPFKSGDRAAVGRVGGRDDDHRHAVVGPLSQGCRRRAGRDGLRHQRERSGRGVPLQPRPIGARLQGLARRNEQRRGQRLPQPDRAAMRGRPQRMPRRGAREGRLRIHGRAREARRGSPGRQLGLSVLRDDQRAVLADMEFQDNGQTVQASDCARRDAGERVVRDRSHAVRDRLRDGQLARALGQPRVRRTARRRRLVCRDRASSRSRSTRRRGSASVERPGERHVGGAQYDGLRDGLGSAAQQRNFTAARPRSGSAPTGACTSATTRRARSSGSPRSA